MNVRVITPPAPLITLERAKLHLVVDYDDEDALIAGLISAATQWVDGPAGWLGRCLGKQTLELSLACWWWGSMKLPYPPVIDLVSVKYIDADGAEQTTDPATSHELHDGRLWLGPAFGRPKLAENPGAVRVQYEAGYANTEQVPAPITTAILLMVGHLYRNREATGSSAVEAVPFGVEALLSPFRVYV
ncbi:head-tail connector protein [Tianweitania sediminis]|uniref:Phage gp6-like head-tail connector protein n=1 Tax=Tianweitania sediminis TaxID=1502156 RepID=A0A8J7UK73_9HYPH|nr:head-tail connector protein [Tianweitania sediminis]MBP0439590.1 phage gp6-like head-tail connector protein [Tianweitania sediminis]